MIALAQNKIKAALPQNKDTDFEKRIILHLYLSVNVHYFHDKN